MEEKHWPSIIQGGMGAGVSHWRLAKAVAQYGGMGVVSGTATGLIFARRLQLGDLGGHIRRAFDRFPVREVADRVYERYFIPGGKMPERPFKAVPMFSIPPKKELLELAVVSNFSQVWLAKEGHGGMVAVNFLNDLEPPHLPSLYGAMLAGVDTVIVGAGIPDQFPGMIESFLEKGTASFRLKVRGRDSGYELAFDSKDVMGDRRLPSERPDFLAIITLPLAGIAVCGRTPPYRRVDGFIVERHIAGGHNAPPRGKEKKFNEFGEPEYGEKDIPNYDGVRKLGKPFWIAGGATLKEANELGAVGIQVGSIFAVCEESGFAESIKRQILGAASRGILAVRTSATASPTGYPFNMSQLEGVISEEKESPNSGLALYRERKRVCDIGELRHLYGKEDGGVGFRCPAERVSNFEGKGGKPEETEGAMCLCNGLLAAIGLAQTRVRGVRDRTSEAEPAIVTFGKKIPELVRRGNSYTAKEAMDYLRDQS